jgi:hypothetical protein
LTSRLAPGRAKAFAKAGAAALLAYHELKVARNNADGPLKTHSDGERVFVAHAV